MCQCGRMSVCGFNCEIEQDKQSKQEQFEAAMEWKNQANGYSQCTIDLFKMIKDDPNATAIDLCIILSERAKTKINLAKTELRDIQTDLLLENALSNIS